MKQYKHKTVIGARVP